MTSPNYGEEAVTSAGETAYMMSQSEQIIRNLVSLLASLPDAEPPPELVSGTLDRLDEARPPEASAAEPS